MITNIQEHHSDEEIETIKLQNEIVQWTQELEFNAQENEFYIDIFESSLIKRTKVNRAEAEYIFSGFLQLRETNSSIIKACTGFLPKLHEMNECDDIQCDRAFLNTQVALRSKIEKHLVEVKNVKFSAFSFLKVGIDKFLK